ncbi:MAG: hypothetical protein ACRDO2_05595 [Nocardioidaceae bacterium]
MTLRVTFHERHEADVLVQALLTGGYEAGMARERFAGEDDGEEMVHVVHTDAPADEVAELIDGVDAWLEVSDPMTGTSAVVEPEALPDAPRRLKRDT